VVNAHRTMIADFTRQPDLTYPDDKLRQAVVEATGAGAADFADATGLALALLGDSIGANMFMVGFAYQKGLLPLSAAAIERALELNGVAVDFNRQAFLWGRRAAHDPATVWRVAGPPQETAGPSPDEFIRRRIEDLTQYQNAAYARRYADLVERARAAEAARAKGMRGLADAVARAYFKLLAYKDEYEVARLYTDGAFSEALERQFAGPIRLGFHLAPPLIADRDPATGHLIKREYGPWLMAAFRLLAGLKGLRGTPFDPFAHAADRKSERRLIAEYGSVMEEIMAGLNPGNHALAVEIAALPMQIRGFGHVKEKNRVAAKECEAMLLARFRGPTVSADAAE
jgi:indolepyruvate ferredoxin oxidoreductase